MSSQSTGSMLSPYTCKAKKRSYDDLLDDYDARLGIGENSNPAHPTSNPCSSPTCSVSSSSYPLDGHDSEPQRESQEETFLPLLLKDKEGKTPIPMEKTDSSCKLSKDISLRLEGTFQPFDVRYNKNLTTKELLSFIALHIYELRVATAEMMTRSNLQPTSDVENELKEQKTLVQNLYLRLDEKQRLLEDCQKQLENARNEVKMKAVKLKTKLHKRLLKDLEELEEEEEERDQNSPSSSIKRTRL